MKAYETRPLTAAEQTQWDAFVDGAINGTLFSKLDYVQHFSHSILGVFGEGNLEGGMVLPTVAKEDGLHAIRSSYVSPYFSPLFGPPLNQALAEKRRKRRVLNSLITYITQEYRSMILPLHPSIKDMVPFLDAHFNLELRYTYILDLGTLTHSTELADSKIGNHVKKARGAGVVVAAEAESNFDYDRALFYEPEDQRLPWKQLVRHLTSHQKATTFIARVGHKPVGGLFLAFDKCGAYNLLSYFDRDCGIRGIPSLLISTAIEYAQQQELSFFDFEGSVLTTIERFFEAFGGRQEPYFQVHWYADDHLFKPIRYNY